VILLSAALVLVALVLLLVGVIATDGVTLIWLSIAASVAAGLLLVWGILQQRRAIRVATTATPAGDASPDGVPGTAPAVVEAPESEPSPVTAQDMVEAHDSEPVVAIEPDTAPYPTPETAVEPAPGTAPAVVEAPESEPSPATAQDVVEAHDSQPVVAIASDPSPGPAVRPVPVREPAVPAHVASPSASAPEVIVLPGRPRYHVPGCRFLAGREDTETVSLSDATARGYTPCSTCRS
jgi:hypothetical protein